MRSLTIALVVAVGDCAHAQEMGSRGLETTERAGAGTAEPSTAAPGGSVEEGVESGSASDESLSLFDRLLRVVSHEEDPDGPINTDRPTFTPANTVVPRGRLQFESGWTFSAERSSQMRATVYDLPLLRVVHPDVYECTG
jgi:hypothetical protein